MTNSTLLACVLFMLLGATYAGMCKDPITKKLVEYDPKTHHCKGGTTAPHTTTTMPTPADIEYQTTLAPIQPQTELVLQETSTARPPTIDRNVPCRHLLTNERKRNGYVCCGRGIFHPDFQTCCYEMVYKYKVHEGMKYKDHACCGLDAHPRDHMPCRSAARNDRIWRAKRLPNVKKIDDYTCQKLVHKEFSYMVTVKKHEQREERYLAKIEVLSKPRKFIYDVTNGRTMPIPYDNNSPKGSLRKKTFLLLSDTYHLAGDYLDLFIEYDDSIFVLPKRGKKKMRKPKRMLKKLLRKCKKIRRQNRKRGLNINRWALV